MLQAILNALFGCPHRRTTFPLTPARRSAAFASASPVRRGTYVVCLDCGKEFGYDWSEMRVGGQVTTRATAPATPATQTSYSVNH